MARGNPKHVQQIEDVARAGMTIVNRQEGSGSRALLDRLLAQRRITHRAVRGYERSVQGHLAVAEVVSAGLVDAGIGVQAAANAFGLDFLPLDQERYDLVIPNKLLDDLPVRVLLDALRRPNMRSQVEALGGYDAAAMGQPLN
ncbi:MAG: hypothetical protein EXR67_02690 [Dehalococcoidia bacterium]|nr:hypothetical protein [Dehalococcoidia bacterium]